ncbi:MAG: hypothetical protein DRJ05_06215 [Bacteroidetes bacterium]|nr:MAG: hypothetical protein DRJ05_06215 [Bacteroidota bacterium]
MLPSTSFRIISMGLLIINLINLLSRNNCMNRKLKIFLALFAVTVTVGYIAYNSVINKPHRNFEEAKADKNAS